MGTGVKEHRLWQDAVALAGDVVRLAQRASRRETRQFTDALVRAASMVALSLADACARWDPSEQRRALSQSRRCLVALETLLAVGRQAGLLDASLLAPLATRQAALARLLAGTTAFVDRQLEHAGTGNGAPAASASR